MQQPGQGPQGPYGSPLLNEIHAHFPALLYTPERFASVRDIGAYVSQQMSERFDVFSSWRNYYQRQMNSEQQRNRDTLWREFEMWWQARGPAQPQQQQPRFRQSRFGPRPSAQPQQQQPQQQPDIQVQAEFDLAALNDPLTNLLLRSFMAPIGGNTTTPATTVPTFWDPVVVAPTPLQISAASSTYAAPTPLDTPCVICQGTIAEGAEIRKLTHCGHFFHKDCIDVWFQRDTRCPTCRHDIRSRRVSNQTAS